MNDHEPGLWHDILHWLEQTIAPWQRVFYGEWDGRRRKRVVSKIVGE